MNMKSSEGIYTHPSSGTKSSHNALFIKKKHIPEDHDAVLCNQHSPAVSTIEPRRPNTALMFFASFNGFSGLGACR